MAPPVAATSDYVTLVSSDGFEFQVLRSCATIAGAIRRMLDPSSELLPNVQSNACRHGYVNIILGNFREASENRCEFENIKLVDQYALVLKRLS